MKFNLRSATKFMFALSAVLTAVTALHHEIASNPIRGSKKLGEKNKEDLRE